MKQIITLILSILPLFSFAQGSYRRGSIPENYDPTKGLRVYLQDRMSYEKYFATPDPDNDGEILIYFLIQNIDNISDSLFVILDKNTLPAMKSALQDVDNTLTRWASIARREKLERYNKAMDTNFPPVGIFFCRNKPRWGEYTYYPYFETIRGVEFSNSEFGFYGRRAAGVNTSAYVDSPHERSGSYFIEISLRHYLLKQWLKYMDYDSLKAKYNALVDKRKGIDELFY